MTTSTRWGVGVKDRSGRRLVDQNSAFGSATSASELFHSVVVQCCVCTVQCVFSRAELPLHLGQLSTLFST